MTTFPSLALFSQNAENDDPDMKRERTAKLPLLLAVLVTVALAASACTRANAFARTHSEPVVVDQAALTSRETLELRTGDRVTIAGYASDVITVEDGGILQIVTDAQDATGRNPVETTYAAIRPGQTEVVITHSLCEGITGCGGPALYYRLQVHVR